MSLNPRANAYAQLRCLTAYDTGFDIGDNSQDLTLEFPVMPEVITLARTSTYQTASVLPLPDGIHIYKSTAPLKIPITFKLHAFNDYNADGAAGLLRLTALLHALSLPLRNSGVSPAVEAPNQADNKGAGASTGGNYFAGAAYNLYSSVNPTNAQSTSTYQSAASGSDGSTVPTTNSVDAGSTSPGYNGPASSFSSNNQVPAFPPVCALRLIQHAGSQWGVKCIGYVESVDVKLRGPWLQADDGSYNLPTSAEFSFVFVHAPSYRNKTIDSSKLTSGLNNANQAFAEDVRDRLYNTEDLALSGTSGTQGIAPLGPVGSVGGGGASIFPSLFGGSSTPGTVLPASNGPGPATNVG